MNLRTATSLVVYWSITLPSSRSAEYEMSDEGGEKEMVCVRISKWTLQKKIRSLDGLLLACGCAASLDNTCMSQLVQMDVNEEG